MTPKLTKIFKTLEKITLFGLLAMALGGGLVFGVIVADIAEGKELGLLTGYRPSTPTKLYDRNGKVFAELYQHKQELISYQKIPPHVVQAFLAHEDDNFFNHFGIDIMGIFRAALINIRAGGIVQGGSTLTQQLAKQIYLNHEGKRDRNFTQKIRETILALQIEEELSKEEILEVFFNVIYMGHGCQGISCASRRYFDKKVEDLTLAEAALLARMPKAPVKFSPFKNPHESMRQHKITLRRMVANNFVRAEDVDRIHKEFWDVYWEKVVRSSPNQSAWSEKLDLAPYFTDYVRQLLEVSGDVGKQKLYHDGLKVYTTLDLDHQLIARAQMVEAMRKGNKYAQRYTRNYGAGGVDRSLFGIFSSLSYILPVGGVKVRGLDLKGKLRKALKDDMLDAGELLTVLTPAENQAAAFSELRKDSRQFYSNLEVQGAFVSIEPRTGYITSMIGGSKFSPKNQYNRVLRARRQPGSAFKVFLYGAAIEDRTLSSRAGLNDAPFFSIAPDGSSWTPVNYMEGHRGMVSVEQALAFSLNTVAVEVFFHTGAEPIIDLASRLMKITNPNRFSSDPALALGVSEVTPFEMATAMSILANDGRDVIPFPIRYVTDQSGNTIYNREAQIRKTLAIKTAQNKIQVVEPGVAFIMRNLLTMVNARGTPSHYVRREAGFYGDLASKTGTTSGWSDSWIVGFNPEYSAVIWFGFDKKLTMGSGASGGPMNGPVLGGFYKGIYKGKKIPNFRDRPDGNRPPRGVIRGPCGGWAMGKKIIRGRLKQVRGVSCADPEKRVKDARQLLLEQFDIKPEELGEKGKVKFKKDN